MQKINNMGVPPQSTQPTQATLQAALAIAPYLECETPKCKGRMFLPATAVKRISPIAIGTNEPMMVPIELNVCAKCGSVLKELLPSQFREDF